MGDENKYIKIADNQVNSLFRKIFDFSGERFQNAAENYFKAANICKYKRDYQGAINCLIKKANCHKQLKDIGSELETYESIAGLYQKIDIRKSIEYYQLLVRHYEKNIKFLKLAKYYNIIGELYENINVKVSIEYYTKTVDVLEAENQKISSAKICEKIVDLYVDLDDYQNVFDNASKAFEILSAEKLGYAEKILLKLFVSKIILDIRNNLFDHDSWLLFIDNKIMFYYKFNDSFEHKLLAGILESVHVRNKGQFEKYLRNYNEIKKLDDTMVKMLSKLKYFAFDMKQVVDLT